MISCHTCGLKFTDKPDLVKHRKLEHSDIIKKCIYFAEVKCDFEKEICWFRHDHSEGRKPTNLSSNFKCRFCDKTFEEKASFMMHRKKEHPNIVLKCRNFKEGNCSYTDGECWYKHAETLKPAEGTQQKQGFWKSQDNTQPPDQMMTRIIGLMENIMKDVEQLKKESMKNQ